MCREMKDSGIERIGKIPLEWSVVKLGKVVDSKSKYPIGDGDHGSINPSMYLEEGIPYIRVQNLTDSKEINWDNMVYINNETQKNNPKSILRKNDILIAKTGTVGKTCIIPSSINEANTTSSVGKITVDKDRFDYRYIFYSLRADFTQDLIKLIASQKTAQPGFNIVDMIEFPVCKPPKEIQEDISNYLDKKVSQIDNIISKQKNLIEKYKAYKQSLITETVTKGLNKNVLMKDSGIEWIGKIPYEYNIVKFNKIAMVKSNLVKVKNYLSYKQVSPENIEKNTGKLLECKTVGENGIISDNHFFYKGQILYSKVRPKLNKVTIAPFDGLCSADMYPIETKLEIKFLLYYMLSNSFLTQVTINDNRVKMPKINREELGIVQVVCPPKYEQKEIADFLDKKCNLIDSVIAKKEQLIEKLESYKKSLIYECVTGKREVN